MIAPIRPSTATAPRLALRAFHVRFVPAVDLIRRGVDLFGVVEELHRLGPCWGRADLSRVPTLALWQPDDVVLAWDWWLLTEADVAAVHDVFLFVAFDGQLSIECLAEGVDVDWAPEPSVAAAAAVAGSLDDVTIDEVPAAAPVGQGQREADRVDTQIELVSELVIAQAAMQQAVAHLHRVGVQDSALEAALENLARVTLQLRDNALRLRSVPLLNLLRHCQQVHARLVGRTTADGPAPTLAIDGVATECDAALLLQLEPLLSRWIEMAAAWQLGALADGADGAGVPELQLSAARQGEQLCISLSGVEGHTPRDTPPGTSSNASCAESTGGPGWPEGLLQAIAALKGRCTVQHQAQGRWRADIRLPLNAGIIDGLLVQATGQRLVLPMAAVDEVLDLRSARQAARTDSDLLSLRGQTLPYVWLDALLSGSHDDDNKEPSAANGQVVVVSHEGERLGLVVDRVIGQHQTVVKPLSKLVRDNALLAGTTILADGQVAMIADIGAALRRTRHLQEMH